MEVKKSHKANLDRMRLTGFLVGLIVALACFLAVMEYEAAPSMSDIDETLIDFTEEDIDILPEEEKEKLLTVAIPPEELPAKAKLNIVDETITAEVQEEQTTGGVTEGDVQEVAEDERQPVAVDEENNPLHFTVVEQLPEYPGGMVEFMKWLTKNLKYPPQAQQQKKQGMVLVSFIINTDGSVNDLKVEKSAGELLDNEALRVMRMMPKWKPGEDKGKPCRTYFCVPVVFKL